MTQTSKFYFHTMNNRLYSSTGVTQEPKQLR